MTLVFARNAWADYQYWLESDLKVLSRINALIRECQRSPFTGTGKLEALRHALSGYWSRRITHEHRMVYRIVDDQLWIVQLRYHY